MGYFRPDLVGSFGNISQLKKKSILTFKEKISINNDNIVTSNTAQLLFTYGDHGDMLILIIQDSNTTVH